MQKNGTGVAFILLAGQLPGRLRVAGRAVWVIHFSTPTRVHSYTVVGLRVIQIVHRSVHRSLRWLARRASVIGASSRAGPGTVASEVGLWPGDSAGSPVSGALSRRPATRRATTSPLAAARPGRADPATRRRGLAARAWGRAPCQAAGAPDWHRMCWAGPGIPAGWQPRGIGKMGWLSWGVCARNRVAWPHGGGSVIVVTVSIPNDEDL
jgi:hypothetical protein